MPTQPIGITYQTAPARDRIGVWPDANGDDVFITDAPYIATDGKSLLAPVPVFDAPGPIYTDTVGRPMQSWRIKSAAPVVPTITVTGGTITPFSRGGVDYVEMLFSASGSFTASGPIPQARWALAAGGANGGRLSLGNYGPGGGGAGGLLQSASSITLASGAYTVTIGAGAPENAVTGGGSNGSNSVFAKPDGTDTAIGGGKGAASGAGNTTGSDGGSGGGGRSGQSAQIVTGGLGTAGQGSNGGDGFTGSATGRGSGGGGGAGGAGGLGTADLAGVGGAGVLMDWIATPRTVCAGGNGTLHTTTGDTASETWGNGAMGSVNGTSGAGGNGFLFLVVRADQAIVVAA